MDDKPTAERFYLRRNDAEECWDLCERNAIHGDDSDLNALLARFYDGSVYGTALGEQVRTLLNAGNLTV